MKAKLGRLALAVAMVASFVACWALPASAATQQSGPPDSAGNYAYCNGSFVLTGTGYNNWENVSSTIDCVLSTGADANDVGGWAVEVYLVGGSGPSGRHSMGTGTTGNPPVGCDFYGPMAGYAPSTFAYTSAGQCDPAVGSSVSASRPSGDYGACNPYKDAYYSDTETLSQPAPGDFQMSYSSSAGLDSNGHPYGVWNTNYCGTASPTLACSVDSLGTSGNSSTLRTGLPCSMTVQSTASASGTTWPQVYWPGGAAIQYGNASLTCAATVTANGSGVATLTATGTGSAGVTFSGWSWAPGDGSTALTTNPANHSYAVASEPAGGWSAVVTATATAPSGTLLNNGTGTMTVTCSASVSFAAAGSNGGSGATNANPQSPADCIPSGWNILNPAAMVGALGCLFIPTSNPFNMGSLNSAFQNHFPFNWISSMVSGFNAIVSDAQGSTGSSSYPLGDICGPRFDFNLANGPVATDPHVNNGADASYSVGLPHPTNADGSQMTYGGATKFTCPPMLLTGAIPTSPANVDVGGWQEQLGNVFGFRVAIRDLEVFAVWFMVSGQIVSMAPWSRIPFPSDLGPGGGGAPEGSGERDGASTGDDYAVWYESKFGGE